MVRFIENHDEPRVAAAFPDRKGRAAAVAVLTLTGAKLLHEGQFEGRKKRLPVFLGRRPGEKADQDLAGFYGRLLKFATHDIFRNGAWRLCERSGWPDNQSCQNILTWCWVKDEERYVIVVNYSAGSSQARVRVPLDELRGNQWRLSDALSGENYDRSGDEMRWERIPTPISYASIQKVRLGRISADLEEKQSPSSVSSQSAPDGKIWGGRFPSAILFCYDPKTGQTEHFGRMDPDQFYCYPTAGDDGMIYWAIQFEKMDIVVFDPGKKTKASLIARSDRKAERLLTRQGERWKNLFQTSDMEPMVSN